MLASRLAAWQLPSLVPAHAATAPVLCFFVTSAVMRSCWCKHAMDEIAARCDSDTAQRESAAAAAAAPAAAAVAAAAAMLVSPAPQAAPGRSPLRARRAGGAPRLSHGAIVRLAPGFAAHSDAAAGPLRGESLGVVVATSSARLQVRALATEMPHTANYPAADLESAVRAPSGAQGAHARIEAGDLVRLAARYATLPAPAGPLTLGGIGRAMSVGRSGSITVAPLRPTAEMPWWYDDAALAPGCSDPSPAAAAAAAAVYVRAPPRVAAPPRLQRGAFAVGDCVRLTDDFRSYSDAVRTRTHAARAAACKRTS